MFHTPYFQGILNMFHTLEDDDPKCFIAPLRNLRNVWVCRLKNEPHPRETFWTVIFEGMKHIQNFIKLGRTKNFRSFIFDTGL